MPKEWLTPPGNREIEVLRPARNRVDPDIPYHFLQEKEPGPAGLETVNTIFLTGKECSFKCLMCDLWKNTLPGPTAPGAIVRQLDYALARLPAARSIKLYNNGNFFDPKAVPLSDHGAILERVEYCDRVIVENHPLLVGDACLRFRDGLTGTLEIAMGLETIHPFALSALNKQLTPEAFRRAAHFLTSQGIRVRAFVLLNPPYVTDPREGIRWAVETVRFAFDCGVDCCSIIATRPGNGVMETLLTAGHYVPPTLDALEEVFAAALELARSPAGATQRLVFVDTWDIGFLSSCVHCFSERKARLEKINLLQINLPPIACSCHSDHG
jgi:archaeosine synthase beta-subunit